MQCVTKERPLADEVYLEQTNNRFSAIATNSRATEPLQL